MTAMELWTLEYHNSQISNLSPDQNENDSNSLDL